MQLAQSTLLEAVLGNLLQSFEIRRLRLSQVPVLFCLALLPAFIAMHVGLLKGWTAAGC